MRILIAPPKQPNPTQGNHVTAFRWARLLEGLGHEVTIASQPEPDDLAHVRPEVLIALHATHSTTLIRQAAAQFPDMPIGVIMTGTDLNVDLASTNRDRPGYRDAIESLEIATFIVLLEPASLERLREIDSCLGSKTTVIPQSAAVAFESGGRDGDNVGDDALAGVFSVPDTFKIAVVGHLRAIKDPLAAAEAARLLPEDSRIHIIHWGAALEEEIAQQASLEMRENRRYDWIGPVSHGQSLQQLNKCDLMVLSSHFEGGPAVLSESIINGVPIIAHKITATCGLLGGDYPGFYCDANRQELADLLLKSERDSAFLELLIQRGFELRERFSEAAETKAIENLVAGLVPGTKY